MCGIVGIYNSNSVSGDRAAAEAMASAIASRGPDKQSVKTLENCVFAHRRLAIIDLDHSSDQPLCDEMQSCMITFNGEIYNYRELRESLKNSGCSFATSGDTEVILKLYMSGGIEALSQLDGMFAFAIYDRRSGNLIMMRDPLGKKPLYYFKTAGDQLIFASTVTALKKHPLWRGTVDTAAVADFLAYNCIPGNRSIYENVFQLPPASLAVVKPDGSMNITRYWLADYSNKLDISLDDAAAILKNKITSAVKKRLIADVPCGVFLSGGVDSAAVAMLAAQHYDKVLNAFTIGFDEQKYDERFLAQQSVEFINQRTTFGLLHNIKVVDCRSFAVLEKLAESCGEPFADLSLLPTAFLSEFAAGKVKFVLSGDGADEIFGGYERYRAMRYCRNLDKLLPPVVLRSLAYCANAIFPDSGKKSRFSQISRFLRVAAVREHSRYAELMLQGSEKERRELYGERMFAELEHDCSRILQEHLAAVTTCQSNEQYAECDLHCYLADDILVKVDRASMHHSLEVRSPFLDKDVVEFAARLPFEFKQQKKSRKIVLKHALKDLIATSVAQGRKRGFALPLGEWFRNEWREQLYTHLLEGTLVRDNWMNKQALYNLINNHIRYRRDRSELLGALLMLELFLAKE